ncbi:MAG TPA: MBL fold metallo-hydrolase [Anaeromyxobacter sp.]|nr:MBL fold metallo-hydrolase [Anaeromyxobacter sp.]
MSGPPGDYLLLALRTPTLPPASHTNAWIVPDGQGGVAVVDPGAPEPDEQARLLGLLDRLAAQGRPLRAVWLTHAHPDHVGAVAAVVERRGVPVRGHRLLGARLGMPVLPVAEGERLGRFRVLETPGHAREHLSFLDLETGALVCGDMASTVSTIVIDPPEGDMAEYVRQLERLGRLATGALCPGHGPPAPDAARTLEEAVAHRRAREALVLAALEVPGTLEEITGRAYADAPAAALPAAARSCLAGLLKLRGEGRARERAGIWNAS